MTYETNTKITSDKN